MGAALACVVAASALVTAMSARRASWLWANARCTAWASVSAVSAWACGTHTASGSSAIPIARAKRDILYSEFLLIGRGQHARDARGPAFGARFRPQFDFVARVQVGMVGVNVPIPVPVAYHTFGGWKRSGFGDLNQHGPSSIMFYTKTKTVTSRWPSGIKDGAEFVIPTMD